LAFSSFLYGFIPPIALNFYFEPEIGKLLHGTPRRLDLLWPPVINFFPHTLHFT